MKIKVIRDDITKQHVDVIVNAGNNRMLGGGGVDGAIHRAAGPQLLLECRTLGGCATGDCKVTKGYNLPAKWIIHTVGPIWIGDASELIQNFNDGVPPDHSKEEKLLASCYRRYMEEAVKLGAKTIAFPSISTGMYMFPIVSAARIAHRTVNDFLDANDSIDEVTFVCWEKDDYNAHMEIHG